MKRWLPLLLIVLILQAQALNLPYDEHADAWTQVKKALAAGKRTHKPTLLVFGANWCTDCRALDKSLRNQKNTALIAKHFEVVKIDVGNFDRNLELSQAYGDPIQDGIPAVVVVNSDGKVRYTTKGGELANARKMSDQGIYDFFAKITETRGVSH
ncbi:thioredoxin fold domain-containing protein [Xylella fastidiosa subsp. fastidiosa]|jgi:thioredoxin-related protein|uniref:Disulphide isomerase n=2 Tax=Xylella fastidiosa TaxID=2371 RepID=Q87CN2_XYLFT|nr:thioredoxin family protein [Xylella fastidiosa]ADN64045.1 putative thiol-disulfide isomerase and thioredoxin [Xylella fastidiosa subsp. fastidiosa GB514]KAF0570311.1 dihydroneopterin aldolase [Xylella fastidiosa subsp. fastidiosa Mus-1]AAO28893.1 disulphide isomerase [Xylella fastidiosa Temecula1]ACB92525.1 putative thiol-disulfide isomerase and thioredoxin [Xylella fastidiosa M23]EGO81930.1 Thiol-disulfide isomerase and thioredoxin [Xylella fastidiosa EB92.1]